MHKITLVGAGKIGEMIAHMLGSCGDYQLTLVDRDEAALKRARIPSNVATRAVDAADAKALAAHLQDQDAVLSAAPFTLSPAIATAAKEAECHYFDLTEDVAATRFIKELAKDAKTAFVPQCGLAPGFISIVAADVAKRFGKLRNVHMRVGALPKYPSNALKYNLTWSTDGLINEYCNPCEAIVEGRLTEVPPLEELEKFSLDGIDYEAFNTSGGLGTLCETLEGKVDNLNYRTVRYPGHRDLLKLLIQDLRLGERRDLMKDIFEHALPVTMQDVVLVFVSVSGQRNGRFEQESYAKKVYSRELYGQTWSAIQITTAAGICAMADLMFQGKIKPSGFVRQEDTPFEAFIANRFGQHYA